MSLATLPDARRSTIVGKQYCSKCNLYKDHMLLRKWTAASGDPDTYIKVESWICCYCDTVEEKRSPERKPTEELMIISRLLKLSGDYDQIRHSTLEVRGDTVILTLKLLPWAIIQASKRVEAAKKQGFFRLGDLWRLQQHGLLKGQLADSQEPTLHRDQTPELGKPAAGLSGPEDWR